jgi:hypothetical protein
VQSASRSTAISPPPLPSPTPLQASRTGDRCIPGTFGLSDDVLGPPPNPPSGSDALLSPASARASAALCVAFHPFVPTLFLAGFDDGRIALFTTTHALPLLVWLAPWTRAALKSGGESARPRQRSIVPVSHVAWVPGRPAAFVAVDADGWLGAWDLLASTVSAQSSIWLLAASGSGGSPDAEGSRVASVDVRGATALAQTAVTVLVTSPTMGVVEAALHAEFVAPRPGEMRALRMLVSRKHL